MKRVFCGIAVIISVVLLLSCEKRADPMDCLSYQNCPFEADVTVITGDFSFSASVICGEWNEAVSVRTTEIIFTAPESLSGIMAERNEKGTVISLGDITFCGDAYSSLVSFTELFSLSAVPSGYRLDGGRTRVTLTEDNGRIIELLLDEKGLPLEILTDEICVRIDSWRISA